MSKTPASLVVLLLAVLVSGSGCSDGSSSTQAPDADAASASDASGSGADAAGSETRRPLPKPMRPNRPRIDLSSRLPEDNPFSEVFAIEDEFERVAALAQLLPTLGADAVYPARALLNGLNDGSQKFGVAEASLLVEFWSRRDPEAAARWALSTSPIAYRGGLLVPAVEAWAAHDPQTAAQEIISHVDFGGLPFAQPMQVALVRGWYDSGKPGLEEFIQGLGVSFTRQRMLYAVADRIAETQGAQAAAEWAEALPADDAKFKLSAYRQTAKVMARTNPQAAAEWCKKVCDGPHGAGVRFMIAQHWAWRQGDEVMRWVSEMPAGRERDQTVMAAFRGWWPRDRDGFRRWANELRKQGIPAWFEPAIEYYVSGLVRMGHPEEALDWISEIKDEEMRRRSTINVAIIWRRQDEAAAEAWLEDSPLSEEQREMVRNPSTKPPSPSDFPNPDALP